MAHNRDSMVGNGSVPAIASPHPSRSRSPSRENPPLSAVINEISTRIMQSSSSIRDLSSHPPKRTSTPMSVPPERSKAPRTTREMLSHMAWLSEEILRASEEKVNLAQVAYDS